MIDIEKEHVLFEKWALKSKTWNAHGLRQFEKEYIENEVSDQWHAWKARAAIEILPNYRTLYEETLAQLLICKSGPHESVEQFLAEYEALAHKAMQGKIDYLGQYAVMLADIAAVGHMREFLALRAAKKAAERVRSPFVLGVTPSDWDGQLEKLRRDTAVQNSGKPAAARMGDHDGALVRTKKCTRNCPFEGRYGETMCFECAFGKVEVETKK